MTLASWSGWITFALIALAASLPIAHRLARGRRSTPDSRFMRTHVAIGLTVAAAAFAHTLAAVPSLGSPGAIGGGMLAIAAGAVAFVVLLAHTGIGLQLRRPALKRRAEKRRAHVATATIIAAAAITHLVVLLRAG